MLSAIRILRRACAFQEETVCRRVRSAGEAEGARVRRAGLRDLAQLKINNVIDSGTLQKLRRRMRQDEVFYLVSLPTAECLFRVGESSDAGEPDTCTRIGLEASSRGKHVQNPAEALTALLCSLSIGDHVCLEVPRAMATAEALHGAGYKLESRSLCISLWSRPVCRIPQAVTDLLEERDAKGELPSVFEYDKHE